MTTVPLMRRWRDSRDDRTWEVLYSPGVEEDPPAVRHLREGLVFRAEGEEYHSPAPFGWDLEGLADADLQGLLDQAREARERARASAGWGAPSGPEGEAPEEGAESA